MKEEYNYNFYDICKKISDKKMCIAQWTIGVCTTCGCIPAVKELSKVKNLEEELLNINLNTLDEMNLNESLSYMGMQPYISLIVFILSKKINNIDISVILTKWLDDFDETYVNLYDAVLFYVIKNIENEIGKLWLNKCRKILELTNNSSLEETIFYKTFKSDHPDVNKKQVFKTYIANKYS